MVDSKKNKENKENKEIIIWMEMTMEILDVVDENGNPIGETVERTVAHKTGVRHRTSHVWVVRKNNGSMEILLQKRSKNKDSHPGCLDCSSAGHIPAGVDFIPSAIRELKEELGIDAKEDEFVYCDYIVEQIDGDYAHLRRVDEPDDELKLVARALLPMEITEGSRLHYELMQYTLIG